MGAFNAVTLPTGVSPALEVWVVIDVFALDAAFDDFFLVLGADIKDVVEVDFLDDDVADLLLCLCGLSAFCFFLSLSASAAFAFSVGLGFLLAGPEDDRVLCIVFYQMMVCNIFAFEWHRCKNYEQQMIQNHWTHYRSGHG